MATPKSSQDAYKEICEKLKEAEVLQAQIRSILKECKTIARRNDLLFMVRHRDNDGNYELPEVLDPNLYEEVTERVGSRTITEKRFKKDIKEDRWEGIEPGESIDSWIPSSIC